MAWSYRRRIKVIPGIHLNISKSGISTSVGIKGASLTFRKSGTYLNTSIPGLGIYNREKISFNNNNTVDTSLSSSESQVFYTPDTDNMTEISSKPISELTSQNMQSIKDAIIFTNEERTSLSYDLIRVQDNLRASKKKLKYSYIFLYGLIKKSISIGIKNDIHAQNKIIKELEHQIENCYLDLDINFDSDIEDKYNKLTSTFKNLTASNKIWDITSEAFNDRVLTRSYANLTISRTEVNFSFNSIPELKTKYKVLFLKNANGSDIYIYPYFIIMYDSKDNLAIISYEELSLEQSFIEFIETKDVPPDSVVTEYTWAKVNKNGSPDKRFKDNYQIPIVKYGEIKLHTKLGMNEEYQFSNYEASEEFSIAFNNYAETIKALDVLNTPFHIQTISETEPETYLEN
ncbi:DUF4236 domain-containing protein [Myroides odoratus]|uniref:DUF4236 domain-containing protein n=1 Tax=Myroides odoratus TaxID=256 RepID=UPI003340B4C4